MIENFPHESSQNYHYEFEEFKRNIVAIWLRCSIRFDYNNGVPTRTIWGFYDTKKQCYYAPINATKQGDQVDIKNTTPYSAMQLNLNPLEAAFI